MVAEQCAIRFLIVVGIKDEVFQLQLQRAALGGEVENLVYYLSRLISLAACLVRHHQCFTVIGRIRAAPELLYPRVFDVVGGRQRGDEVFHQLIAGVAAVGIAQNELRPAIAVALDSFGQLRELLVLHGYLVIAFSGVHVEHVHIHLHVVAQIYGIEAEALVDKRIGSVVETTQRLVPLGPALVSERHSLAIFVLILEQEHQAIGIEMETAEDATGIDSSAPCAHLIVLLESNDQVSVIVEVLADTHHVDTLVGKILSDGLRTLTPGAIGIDRDSRHSLWQTVNIECARGKLLVYRRGLRLRLRGKYTAGHHHRQGRLGKPHPHRHKIAIKSFHHVTFLITLYYIIYSSLYPYLSFAMSLSSACTGAHAVLADIRMPYTRGKSAVTVSRL